MFNKVPKTWLYVVAALLVVVLFAAVVYFLVGAESAGASTVLGFLAVLLGLSSKGRDSKRGGVILDIRDSTKTTPSFEKEVGKYHQKVDEVVADTEKADYESLLEEGNDRWGKK